MWLSPVKILFICCLKVLVSCHGANTSSSSTDEISQKTREYKSKDLYSIEAYYKKLQTLADSRESRKYKKKESELLNEKNFRLLRE